MPAASCLTKVVFDVIHFTQCMLGRCYIFPWHFKALGSIVRMLNYRSLKLPVHFFPYTTYTMVLSLECQITGQNHHNQLHPFPWLSRIHCVPFANWILMALGCLCSPNRELCSYNRCHKCTASPLPLFSSCLLTFGMLKWFRVVLKVQFMFKVALL